MPFPPTGGRNLILVLDASAGIEADADRLKKKARTVFTGRAAYAV